MPLDDWAAHDVVKINGAELYIEWERGMHVVPRRIAAHLLGFMIRGEFPWLLGCSIILDLVRISVEWLAREQNDGYVDYIN